MPVDWDKFSSDLGPMVEAGAKRTDERLASRISSVTRMTDEEIMELFPEPSDAKKLAELMQIVKSAENRNTKISNIVSNSEKFGGIILSLLDKYV